MSEPVLEHAELSGERVRLRPLVSADVERAYPMLRENDAILRWLVWDGPESPGDLERFYAEWVRRGECGYDYHFAICDAESGEFAGCIGPRFSGHPRLGDVGYWLGTDYWGRGLMTEAVKLVNHLCFRHLGASVLYAYVFVGNTGSRTVLERAGYRCEYTARGKVVKRGEPVDEWYFTCSRASWERDFAAFAPREENVRLAGG